MLEGSDGARKSPDNLEGAGLEVRLLRQLSRMSGGPWECLKQIL